MPKIHVNNIDLYYETTGQGDPLLFIHGLGSSTRDWEYQTDFFARHYQVILFDVRGHGQSDKPAGPYNMSLFASDTAELIKALDIAPSHVVGISMGGMIALQLAVDHPELLRSLVVVNATSEVIARTTKERLAFLQRDLIVRLLGMRKMGEVLGKRLFPEPDQEEIRHTFTERWAENDPRAYRSSMGAIVGWSVTERLNEITCPTLIISAEYDYMPLEEKKMLVDGIKGAELVVIKNSHHGTPVDQPEEFNRVLSDFLDRVN